MNLELILVSQSPRRAQILLDAGFLFRVDTIKVSEIIDKNLSSIAAIESIARTKGQEYLNHHNSLKGQDILILSADTAVILGDEILGKPKNFDDAVKTLDKLSSKTHRVITSIYLMNLKTGAEFLGSDITQVTFRNLDSSEIRTYVQSGEPMDKAGSYAIQGAGKKFVTKVQGSFFNVVGLPLELLESVLKKESWNVHRK